MSLPRVDLVEPELASPFDAALSQIQRQAPRLVETALARGDVALAFQPVMRAGGDGVAFYEGLVRVFDDQGKVIPARDFIASVEDSEIGRRLDCAALALGLQALSEAPDLRLSINMSARSIGYPAWRQILKAHMVDAPHDLDRLILEITESSAMLMPEIVRRFIGDLHAKGISFALDDFGAGYTAFRYLKQFDFDILKVDGQFIRDVAHDPDNQVLCAALLSIAHHFDLLTVAESVENAQDAAWLRDLGFDCLQGYHFAAPSLRRPWEGAGQAAREA